MNAVGVSAVTTVFVRIIRVIRARQWQRTQQKTSYTDKNRYDEKIQTRDRDLVLIGRIILIASTIILIFIRIMAGRRFAGNTFRTESITSSDHI